MALRKTQIAVAVVAVVSVVRPSAQTAAGTMWGTTNQGLRIGISAATAFVPVAHARFVVSLQNTGKDDVVLNLGMMLANGRVMFPDAIRIVLTNPDGKSRELKFFDRRYPGIAGRVDDFIVALRGGATYVLPITLDQYWNADTGEYGVKLKPGRNRIAARFEGRGAVHPTLDMTGVKLLNFWKGLIDSGALQFVAS